MTGQGAFLTVFHYTTSSDARLKKISVSLGLTSIPTQMPIQCLNHASIDIPTPTQMSTIVSRVTPIPCRAAQVSITLHIPKGDEGCKPETTMTQKLQQN